MADEASVVIVARMRDEASVGMQKLGATTQKTQFTMQELSSTLTATGSAMAAVGALMSQMDSPMAKTASKFLMIGGAILTTSSAIMTMLPLITKLTASLRSMAIAQTLVHALSGPVGWALLGGAVVGGGIGIASMSRGSQGNTSVINNIQGSVITEREVGEITRREIIKNQDRNSSSGIK